jgi:hypothetical protein
MSPVETALHAALEAIDEPRVWDATSSCIPAGMGVVER